MDLLGGIVVFLAPFVAFAIWVGWRHSREFDRAMEVRRRDTHPSNDWDAYQALPPEERARRLAEAEKAAERLFRDLHDQKGKREDDYPSTRPR